MPTFVVGFQAEQADLEPFGHRGKYREVDDDAGACLKADVRLPPMTGTYRIIVAKPGLDGHDRGAKIVARALRDAGFEVIYTGIRQTPEMIAESAIQEDADAVGLSCHSGAHMTLFPKVVAELRERGASDVLVFGGGIIPADDIPKLEAAGVEKIFTPGANTGEMRPSGCSVRASPRLPRADPKGSAWTSTNIKARSCSEPTVSRSPARIVATTPE